MVRVTRYFFMADSCGSAHQNRNRITQQHKTVDLLAMILGGVELGSAKTRPRYEHPAAG